MKNNTIISLFLSILFVFILLLLLGLNLLTLNIFLSYFILLITNIIIGIFIFNKNLSWTNEFFEKVGIGMVSGLSVSLLRDFSLQMVKGMLIHFYIVAFFLSLSLIFIGAFSKSQNK
jgi:hypothetical protein